MDHGAIPRPLNMFNQTDTRCGRPERFASIPGDSTLPPNSGLPFYQVDEGQAGPRFIRPTVMCAPAEQKL